jgi:hypothetical protein
MEEEKRREKEKKRRKKRKKSHHGERGFPRGWTHLQVLDAIKC